MERFGLKRLGIGRLFQRILRPKVIVAIAWIASLLLVLHCTRFVGRKVYINVEHSLIQPKESPPLLGYLLLNKFYTPTDTIQHFPLVLPTVKETYEDIDNKLRKPRCAIYNLHQDMPKLNESTKIDFTPICVNKKSPTLLTLFTTMYDRKDKMFIFNNTVNMWPKLEGIKPVLFVTPMKQNSPHMIRLLVSACNQGWDVLVAPHCNNDTYPVLRSMYHIVLNNYDSMFYGYTNGDIVFDDTLPLTLSHLVQQDPHIFHRKHLICGQRHNVYVSRIMSSYSYFLSNQLLYIVENQSK